MSTFAGPAGITINPSATLVALVTVSTALVFGLALLPRPSRATVTWAVGFAVAMFATYLWVAAVQFDSALLRAGSSALIVCFEPFLWVGVRYYVRKRPRWPAALPFLVLGPPLLVLTAQSEFYPTAFRIVFSAGAVYAAMTAWELFRMRLTARDVVLPLALVCSAFVVVAVLAVVAGVAGIGATRGDELSLVRDINGVGILLTSQCAAITIVLLARGEALLRGQMRPSGERELDGLRHRLHCAAERQENGWSLLDVRLDDPADLLDASGGTAYGRIVDAFWERVRAAVPAAADVVRLSGDRALVLLPGSEEAVRHHLHELLAHVSLIEQAAVRVSASVGWASAGPTCFDLDVLRRHADQAAQTARDRGGDRWERASVMPQAVREG